MKPIGLMKVFKNLIVLVILALHLGINSVANAQGEPSEHEIGTVRPVRNEEVNKIAGKLIAPCCWKQTADVHSSEAAEKIKAEIRASLSAGLNEEQIIDHFVAEYGKRILAIPKPEGFDLTLWILLALVVLIGGLLLLFYLRRIAKYSTKSTHSQPMIVDTSIEDRVERELAEYDQ
jgi:cytochrome c-type biogenesis protein CcmH